jgi:hypothetical protein
MEGSYLVFKIKNKKYFLSIRSFPPEDDPDRASSTASPFEPLRTTQVTPTTQATSPFDSTFAALTTSPFSTVNNDRKVSFDKLRSQLESGFLLMLLIG